MESITWRLNERVCELIRENFNPYFAIWIEDAWHAGFPTLYVDVIFGTLDKEKTLRGRLGDTIYKELQRKVEIMGEHISHATSAFVRTLKDPSLEVICMFVGRLIDSQLRDNELSMFFEEESEDEKPVTTSSPSPV